MHFFVYPQPESFSYGAPDLESDVGDGEARVDTCSLSD